MFYIANNNYSQLLNKCAKFKTTFNCALCNFTRRKKKHENLAIQVLKMWVCVRSHNRMNLCCMHSVGELIACRFTSAFNVLFSNPKLSLVIFCVFFRRRRHQNMATIASNHTQRLRLCIFRKCIMPFDAHGDFQCNCMQMQFQNLYFIALKRSVDV